MKVAIRKMGNSQGVIIPKPVLAQAGLVSEAEMRVENGVIMLERPSSAPRAGWAEASKKLITTGDDELVWPKLGSESDKDLRW